MTTKNNNSLIGHTELSLHPRSYKVSYGEDLPLKDEIMEGSQEVPLVIYDRCVKASSVGFQSWVHGMGGAAYPVDGGEELKSIDHFPNHIKSILEKTRNISRQQLRVISVGGGSVGDFSGFVASILKRGVRLTHLPSTWLAAMDSAHGGKTALNVGPYKNQLGSFYQAQNVIICKSLLRSLPQTQTKSAMGELCKMALIGGGAFYQRLKEIKNGHFESLWEFLPQAVQLKYDIVEQDLREEKGIREKLNLGHTLGHVLESVCKIPHGEAVAQGLWFSLRWSERLYSQYEGPRIQDRKVHSQRGGIGQSQKPHPQESVHSQDWKELYQVLLHSIGPQKMYKLTESQWRDHLFHDKKRLSSSHIRFVFIRSPGHVEVKPVAIDSLVYEIKRQIIPMNGMHL